MLYMETNVNPVFLVLILMISQKIRAATYTTGNATPQSTRHANNETTTAIVNIRAVDAQFPPTTIAPEKLRGTVGVSQSPFGPFPMRD